MKKNHDNCALEENNAEFPLTATTTSFEIKSKDDNDTKRTKIKDYKNYNKNNKMKI